MKMMRRNYVVIGLGLAMVLFTFSVSAQEATVGSKSYDLMLQTLLDHSVPEITVEEAIDIRENAVFLDARERNEFEISHIENSTYVGYDNFDLARLEGIPKDQPIVVYCSVGYRSEKVSEQLLAAGYQDVANLYGGIFEWKNQQQPVVNMKGKDTERVHAYNRTWGVWLNEGKRVY